MIPEIWPTTKGWLSAVAGTKLAQKFPAYKACWLSQNEQPLPGFQAGVAYFRHLFDVFLKLRRYFSQNGKNIVLS